MFSSILFYILTLQLTVMLYFNLEGRNNWRDVIKLIKIGEFSKIVGLSVKTLRFYEECNILKPCYVDHFTGYRYYSKDQIIDCNQIKFLKSIGFTLGEIAMYKDNMTVDVLERKKEELNYQMHELSNKITELSYYEGMIKNNSNKGMPKTLKRTLN